MQMCYNKGCGSKFDLKDNKDDSCEYHPGGPIFHDAYKGWSCCDKKTTDFTTFLNMKGCTKGQHNPEKPPEPPKYVPDPSTKEEVIMVKAYEPHQLPRPDLEEDMEYLKINVAKSLQQALQKEEEKKESELGMQNSGEILQGIRIGEPCKNNACKKTFEGLGSNLELCKHHPGLPIFHEGMKYWTCCQRKTSDFDSFLQQEGCQTTQHMWIKKESNSGICKKTNCRFDWHQTGTHVIVSVYAKLSRPESTTVQVNPIRLNAHVVYAEGYFDLDVELKGVITVNESSVTLMGTKVEIKLRKAEALSWDRLNVPKVKAAKDSGADGADKDDLLCRIDAVDLSGL
ncbi:unnamed protein product, partial [Meganyctiphanes norvegica]